jgi:hypothetical protein
MKFVTIWMVAAFGTFFVAFPVVYRFVSIELRVVIKLYLCWSGLANSAISLKERDFDC